MSAELRELVEGYLASSFLEGDIPARLSEAMRYSLLAGGKRLRPGKSRGTQPRPPALCGRTGNDPYLFPHP